jgi:hypothetical protein
VLGHLPRENISDVHGNLVYTAASLSPRVKELQDGPLDRQGLETKTAVR